MTHKDDRDRFLIPDSDHEILPIARGDQELHLLSGRYQESHSMPGGNSDRYSLSERDQDQEGRSRWEKATIVITFLKRKIAKTLILKI